MIDKILKLFQGFSLFASKTKNFKSDTEKSWDMVENFYKKVPPFKGHFEILVLINEIRSKGFDKRLYANLSMYTLRISKKPFIDPAPKYSLFFHYKIDGSVEICQIGTKFSLHFPKMKYCIELEQLLKELEQAE